MSKKILAKDKHYDKLNTKLRQQNNNLKNSVDSLEKKLKYLRYEYINLNKNNEELSKQNKMLKNIVDLSKEELKVILEKEKNSSELKTILGTMFTKMSEYGV